MNIRLDLTKEEAKEAIRYGINVWLRNNFFEIDSMQWDKFSRSVTIELEIAPPVTEVTKDLQAAQGPSSPPPYLDEIPGSF